MSNKLLNIKGDISKNVMYKAIDITNKILSSCSENSDDLKKSINSIKTAFGNRRSYSSPNMILLINVLYNNTKCYFKNSQKVYNNIISSILNKPSLNNTDLNTIMNVINYLVLYYTEKNKDKTKDFILYTFMTIYNKLELMSDTRSKNYIKNKLSNIKENVPELKRYILYYNNKSDLTATNKYTIRPGHVVSFWDGSKWVNGTVQGKTQNGKISIEKDDKTFNVDISKIIKNSKSKELSPLANPLRQGKSIVKRGLRRVLKITPQHELQFDPGAGTTPDQGASGPTPSGTAPNSGTPVQGASSGSSRLRKRKQKEKNN